MCLIINFFFFDSNNPSLPHESPTQLDSPRPVKQRVEAATRDKHSEKSLPKAVAIGGGGGGRDRAGTKSQQVQFLKLNEKNYLNETFRQAERGEADVENGEEREEAKDMESDDMGRIG